MGSASSFAIYFDIVNAHNNPIPDSEDLLRSPSYDFLDKYGMIQFRTNYLLPNGTRVTRITTVAHNWSPPARGLQVYSQLLNIASQIRFSSLSLIRRPHWLW